MQAGQIAAAEGVAGLVLHARTADQQYGPPVHWEAVARLVQAVAAVSGSSSSGCSCPVIGNGDVFEAADAVELMRQTGCQGETRIRREEGERRAEAYRAYIAYSWQLVSRNSMWVVLVLSYCPHLV